MSLVVPLEEIFASETGLLSAHHSWPRVQLGELCTILNGFPFKSALFNRSKGNPVIRIRDLDRNETETLYDGEIPTDYWIKKGDLLIGMDGLFRCCEWQGRKAGLNQRVCKISANERRLHPKFLLYGLNGYLKAIEAATSSVTVGHLSSRDILRIPFPIPPLQEQRRIVPKLELLLSRVDGSKKRLERIPLLLKRFRQSVLAAACSGRLTEDWRNDRSLSEDVNCSTSEFPVNWSTKTLRDLAKVTSGFAFRSVDFVKQGIPAIKISNVQYGEFIEKNQEYLAERFLNESPSFQVHPGTLLMALTRPITNETLKVCFYPTTAKTALLNQRVCKIEPKEVIAKDYLHAFMQTEGFKKQVKDNLSETLQPNLSPKALESFSVILPPVSEQIEIVKRVEELFKLADEIQQRYEKGKAFVDKLTQSILAKAFRGELVPQDPNDTEKAI